MLGDNVVSITLGSVTYVRNKEAVRVTTVTVVFRQLLDFAQ